MQNYCHGDWIVNDETGHCKEMGTRWTKGVYDTKFWIHTSTRSTRTRELPGGELPLDGTQLLVISLLLGNEILDSPLFWKEGALWLKQTQVEMVDKLCSTVWGNNCLEKQKRTSWQDCIVGKLGIFTIFFGKVHFWPFIVRFWLSNSKTRYSWPSNYQNHSYLAIGRFC